MTIALTAEISNEKIQNFSELEQAIAEMVRGIGQEVMKQSLEHLDTELPKKRDAGHYRCKSFQTTCIKTSMGDVEFKRRVYVDKAASESKHRVYLMDETLNIDKVELVSEEVCQLVSSSVCEAPSCGLLFTQTQISF